MKKKINISKKLLGSALAIGITANLAANAVSNNALSIGEIADQAVVMNHDGDHKCGEGKCGEGKCGEGKCGEGKCGKDKKKK